MGLVKGMKMFGFVYILICVIAIGIGITVWNEGTNKKEITPCTLPGVTSDMICTNTPDGCSCELSHDAFMAEMRRRACMYKMAGFKLVPDVEKDLREHPEMCPGIKVKP
jgi:hypothetical protein